MIIFFNLWKWKAQQRKFKKFLWFPNISDQNGKMTENLPQFPDRVRSQFMPLIVRPCAVDAFERKMLLIA